MQPTDANPYIIPSAAHLSRLDAALGHFLAGMGIRGRRRLCSSGLVLVNGTVRDAGFLVREGDRLVILGPISGSGDILPPQGQPAPEIAALANGYIAFIKPPGLHTARIQGSLEPSLEGLLADCWESMKKDGGAGHRKLEKLSRPTLVSRLDKGTSGLVLAVFTESARSRATVETRVREFRLLESQGKVRKTYLAVVHGRLSHRLECRFGLDTDSRRITRVRSEEDPDPARHTLVEPLCPLVRDNEDDFRPVRSGQCPEEADPAACQPYTLVRATIFRGARHQIRAHLAQAGNPIAGDRLYGQEDGCSRLYLHHAHCALPDFRAFCPARWNLGEQDILFP